MTRALLAGLLIASLAAPTPVSATPRDQMPFERWWVYAGDVLLTRPVTFAAMLAGAGIWTATLPFTALADPGTAFGVLVADPAAFTFTRCVGCRYASDAYGERRP